MIFVIVATENPDFVLDTQLPQTYGQFKQHVRELGKTISK